VLYAYSTDTPVAVRYPNAAESSKIAAHFNYADKSVGVRLDFDPLTPPKNIYLTYGQISEKVIDAKRMLSEVGVDVGIVLIERIKPYAPVISFIERILSNESHIVYVEEGIQTGGAAMITRDLLFGGFFEKNVRFDIAAIDDCFASPSEPCDLYDYVGLSCEKLVKYFLQ
jgi:deoxyxylulose-5-phosphate synthase